MTIDPFYDITNFGKNSQTIMKKYHVYGIGNALVDIELEVSPQQLTQLRVEKGVMTLIDETHQQEILDQLHAISLKKSCGGSAANTLVAISQFGGKGFYSCKVANDPMGCFYLEDLLSNGVDTNLHGEKDEGITGKCLVFVTPDADRTLTTFLGITANFSEKELVIPAIESSEYLYVEGYLVTSETGRNAAIKAREIAEFSGVKTSLSLSDLNMAKYFRDGLLAMIGEKVDLLFANESEALTMAQTDNLTIAIDYLKTISRQFAITLGAKGSLIYDGQTLLEIDPHSVKAIDTVGAGDMYAGAFLFGITQGMSYTKAGELASLASAKIVTQYGARLSQDQIQSILSQLIP